MKVLASDFDNTLYFKNEKNGFKNDDIQAIQEFQERGHLFGLCSGRPIAGLLHTINGIIEPDFYIASTGAIIMDKDNHLLYGAKIPFEIVRDISLKYQNETELLVQTLSMDKVYISCADHQNDDHTIWIESIDDVRYHDIYSLSLIESTNERAMVITQEINEQYHEVSAYQNMNSIDIVAKGCSKGKAIEKLKTLFHWQDIAGIGDSYNDLPMIEVVDSSFTFCYSPEVIQKQCDHVVKNLAEALKILERSEER